MTSGTALSYPAENTLLELTADVVSAYISNNAVPVGELSNLISDVHKQLTTLNSGSQPEPQIEAAKPAVNPKKSVHDDFIICLEDGKKFKSLKRHLMTHYGLSPEEYRAKWNLPHDYPMVAPSYAAARSALAKSMGLGRKPAAEPAPAPVKPSRAKSAPKSKAKPAAASAE